MSDIILTTPDNRKFIISHHEYEKIQHLIRECENTNLEDCSNVYNSCSDCPLYIIGSRHSYTQCSEVLDIINHKKYTFRNIPMRIFD